MQRRSLINRIGGAAVAAAGIAFAPGISAQNVAGTVEFFSGQASIRNSAGQVRAVSQGAALTAGDSVETALGRLQLRMVDGAYISLQPQTLLRIDEYSISGAAGVEERGFLRLLRGGLRTVTGVIGRVNRANYRLTTPTATVGIRGTEYSATADDGTRVNVAEGLVALCNDGGCVDIGAGQSGFAPDKQARPVLSFAPARLPPTASTMAQTITAAEQRGDNGASAILSQVAQVTGSPTGLTVVPLANGGGTLLAASVTAGGSFSAGVLGGTLTFAPGGALTQSIDCCTSVNNYTAGVSSDFGADGIIAWGRWTSGAGQNGQPLTTMHYIAALATSNVTAPNIIKAYTSFASTAPTVTSGGSIVAVGTPNSVTGSLNVNFPSLTGGGSLTYQLNIPVASQTFSINGSANQYSGTAFLGSSSTISSTGAGCTPSCSGNIPFGNAIQGLFTGASAQRAGANYGFNSQIGQVSGAVVFK